MASIDTNVLLRWVMDDVPEHTARVAALFASGERLHVDDATLMEAVYVLERVKKISRERIGDTIKILAAEACLDFDRAHWVDVAAQFEYHPKLSIYDVHLGVRARERGEVLFTFDKKLANQLPFVEEL